MAVWAKLRFFLKWIHWLSLDIVLGAVGGLAFAYYTQDRPFSIPVALILGLSVWIIYLIDHLGDSLRMKESNPAKYYIFSSHRSFFLYLIIFLAALNSYLIFHYLVVKIIAAGTILCFLVFLYLFLQQVLSARFRNYFPKEVIISVFYISAIWFIPLAEATDRKYIPLALHFLLTFINILLFSFFERSEDLKNQRGTFLSYLSASKLKMIIISICLFILVFSLVFLNSAITSVLVGISVVYFLEVLFSESPFIMNNYAEITDGMFMLFLLFIFWL